MQFFRQPIAGAMIATLLVSFVMTPAAVCGESALLPSSASYWAGQFASLPGRLAVLEEVYDSRGLLQSVNEPGRTDRTLLLIEDTPDNAEVQARLAEILNLLAIQSGIGLVFVEGAEGDVSIPFVRPSGVSAERARVIRDWTQQLKLSGPEAAQLISSSPITVVGADNSALYDRTVQAYLHLEVLRDRAKRHLKSLSLLIALLNQTLASSNSDKLAAFQNTLKDLAEVVQLVSREPGTLNDEEIRQMLGRYGAASSAANRLVRQIGLGDTGLFFNDPVFQRIAGLESKLGELSRLRDTEIVRRVLESMDERQVSAAVLVIRPARLKEVAGQIQASGASFLRIRPVSGGPNDPSAYAAEVRRQFKSSPIFRHALKENEQLYLDRSANPLRTLPLMARAPLEMARKERTGVERLTAELGEESADQTNAMAQALSQAIQNSELRVIPMIVGLSPSAGRGNPQTEVEALPVTVAPPVPPAVKMDLPEPLDPDAENQERYRAFVSHLKSLGVPLPADLRKSPNERKNEDAAVIQSRFNEYADRLLRLWDGGKERLDREAAIAVQEMPGKTAKFSAKSADSIWRGLWNDPQVRGKFLSLAGRWGWIRPAELTSKDLARARQDHAKLAWFMTHNKMPYGLPKSYLATPDYWRKVHTATDAAEQIDEVLERLINDNCLLIYDGAVWQIALALLDPKRFGSEIDRLNGVLLEGTIGDLETIRAWKDPYRYGDDEAPMSESNAYFFRLISDHYIQADTMSGLDRMENFPNHPLLHHEDWKPITGEQAWAAILGPLHSAHLTGKLREAHPEALRLAESILPALEAMASPTGAIYHAPHGTHGKSGYDISNENNFSVLAALRILRLELLKKGNTYEASRVAGLISGILSYFRQYGFDSKEGIFFQGGFYLENRFLPSQVFAVDCQTWGIAALGPDWIDREFGEGTSYRIWQTTRRRAGYYDDWGRLLGIGFTDQDRVLSVEWTAGAVLACRMMAQHYAVSHPEWAKELESDSIRMRLGMDQFRTKLPDGSEAYLYANRRFFIPFGWWANPLPSLVSTAWVVLLDKQYNPFWPEGVYPADLD